MKCPNCKDQSLAISERQGIEIDYCPECRGIWLDRGELDKILEKTREAAPAESREPAYQQPHYQGHKPYKRKKSFLEELFD